MKETGGTGSESNADLRHENLECGLCQTEGASKKQGVSAVKAPAFSPSELVQRLTAAAAAQGFRVEPFGEADACPLVAFTRRTPGARRRIYLSAGIHGDEPAGPLALLAMLETGRFSAAADWLICPLLNPAGFNRRQRENADGVDLNRDYRSLRSTEIAAHIRWLNRQPNFDLALCLHEDWEATGFYLYELNPGQRPGLAEPMIEAVRPICPIDPSGLIDGRPAQNGILRPSADPATRELWPESIYLQAHHTRLSYTIETPSGFPLEQRISALAAAADVAIKLTVG
jgi:protein MpaA